MNYWKIEFIKKYEDSEFTNTAKLSANTAISVLRKLYKYVKEENLNEMPEIIIENITRIERHKNSRMPSGMTE